MTVLITYICPTCCRGTDAPRHGVHTLQFCFVCRRSCLQQDGKTRRNELFCGFDLQYERTALWLALQRQCKIARTAIPSLAVQRGKQKRAFVTGHAWFAQHRVTMTINAQSDAADALETLAHELTHLAYPALNHQPGFYGALRKLLHSMYGIEPVEFSPRESMFDRDSRLVLALRDALQTKAKT